MTVVNRLTSNHNNLDNALTGMHHLSQYVNKYAFQNHGNIYIYIYIYIYVPHDNYDILTIVKLLPEYFVTLLWRHNESDDVWNHQHLDCLLNCLFRRRPNKTPKLRVTGLCEGNSPVTGEFPAQRASDAENDFIWWRHHEKSMNSVMRSNAIILDIK